MRILEVVLVCILLCPAAAAIWAKVRQTEPWNPLYIKWFSIVAMLLLAAHLYVEGGHWQMAPAYAGVAILILLAASSGTRRVFVLLVLLSCAAACCGLSWLLPMFQLPRPTGLFPVGTRILSLVDDSRLEDASPDGKHPRELTIQIWYPALQSRNPPAPYRRRSETNLASSYQSVLWTDARYNAPVAEAHGAFPVLLYNPGWNGRRTQDTFLTEELASHGYIIVAIDHPFNSGPVEIAGGQVIRPVATPQLIDNTTPAAAVYSIINKELTKETEDTLFVLRQIEETNKNSSSPFYQHLDLEKIGALGYSLGGAVAAEAAYRNPRIKAVLVLDTPLYGEAAVHGVSQPLMLLSEEMTHTSAQDFARMSFGERRDLEMDEEDYARQIPLFRRPGDYLFALHGTVHTSFQDVALSSPRKSLSGAGDIDPHRLMLIVRAYSVAFFDESIRKETSPLLKRAKSPFVEVSTIFSGDH